jgi:hypothetical protein
MPFEFTCSCCGEVHRGMPAFSARAPVSYYAIPEEERASRCKLGTDDCIIDGDKFFILGCIEVPVHGEDEPFSWGVWVSLSQTSYEQWRSCLGKKKRSHMGPFFGWLNAVLKPYPTEDDIKTRVHLRDDGIRPYIELEPTDFPLSVEQREGISPERAARLYEIMVHGEDAS